MDEIASAVGAPRVFDPLVRGLARLPSARLGRRLARFDDDVRTDGLATAARRVLEIFGARIDVSGVIPRTGAVLVVTNHPGAYDALAIMSALARDDVALVAADRPFLRAMPHVSERLVLVPDEGPRGRAMGLRRALASLARGEVVVQFGAGEIEPDPRFDRAITPERTWGPGTGLLATRAARAGALVVPCLVSGVCSPRAKALALVRWAEARGITTIAPLLQATLPGFRDVVVSIRIGPPILFDADTAAAAATARVRDAVMHLA